MKPLVFAILDGWGINPNKEGNAVINGRSSFMEWLRSNYPTTKVSCSGQDVGLPKNYQGNSEVGHINLGAGRVVYQMLERINKSIEDGSFYSNSELLKTIEHCKSKDGKLHLMGLLSNEGVHSHQNHLYSLLKLASEKGIDKVRIHVFTDGRDTKPQEAKKFISQLQEKINEIGVGKISTIEGRYYAMDRDKRWDRTEKAYLAIDSAKGNKGEDPLKVIDDSYENGENDEFVQPTVMSGYEGVEDGDSIIFFNYRLDRARQITQAFTQPDFNEFTTTKKDISYCAFTKYYEGVNANVAFLKPKLKNILGEVISNNGMKQLRISETEKYAHVTYFFNNENEEPFEKEDHYIIHSPKVSTYDLQPEMSAYEIKDKVLEVLDNDQYDVIILNFANGDMVGHTGVYEAGLKAVDAVSSCVEEIYNKVKEKQGVMVVGADHGNCEEMIDSETKKPLTAHTTNLVPYTITKEDITLDEGKLADVAPTLLEILGIQKPDEMTGESMIRK